MRVGSRSCARLWGVGFAIAVCAWLGSWVEATEPTVWISYPEPEQWFGASGIASAAGNAVGYPEGSAVYVAVYYYSAGNYDYVYWDWVTGTWHTGPSWEATMRLATGMDSWSVTSGFPTDWQEDRTYALYACIRGPSGIIAADVRYFYIDATPPDIGLNIIRPVLTPANRALVLAAEVSATDAHDPAPLVAIRVSSNDRIQPPRPRGRARADYEIVRAGDVWQVWLRAEKDHRRRPRIYTIEVQSIDWVGNTSSEVGTVTVP